MNNPDLIHTMAEVSELATAHRSARCAVAGCERPIKARGWCDTHYTRWRRTGDPGGETPINTRSVPELYSYSAVRRQLGRERGRASALECVDCGTAARDWSYDHSDADERVDPGRGHRYSTDPGHYIPRCRSCHRRATRRGARPLDATHYAELYRNGTTLAALADLTGHSTAEIRRTLVAHGIPIRQKRRRQRHTHPHHQAAQRHSTP